MRKSVINLGFASSSIAEIFLNTDDVYIEHGLTRIGRMGFATGSQNSVGIWGIRVREEENDVVYLETNLT